MQRSELTTRPYLFKGKAYDRWVYGDVFTDYENTYIRVYSSRVNERGELLNNWTDWVVEPKTVELINRPKIKNSKYRVSLFADVTGRAWWAVQKKSSWFGSWYYVPHSLQDKREKAEAFKTLLELGVTYNDIFIQWEAENLSKQYNPHT